MSISADEIMTEIKSMSFEDTVMTIRFCINQINAREVHKEYLQDDLLELFKHLYDDCLGNSSARSKGIDRFRTIDGLNRNLFTIYGWNFYIKVNNS